MDSLAKAFLASGFGKSKNTPKERPAGRVELLASRFENGLDLWTGEPLNSVAVIEPEPVATGKDGDYAGYQEWADEADETFVLEAD